MRQLVIDRYEGKYVICEDKDMKYFAIEVSELPKEAGVGMVIEIDDAGQISVNKAETERRRERIAEKQGRVFR